MRGPIVLYVSPRPRRCLYDSAGSPVVLQSFAHGYNPKRPPAFQDANHQRARRMSHDEKSSAPRRFLIDVEDTIRLILEQEDTDGDFQISITDAGPKILSLGTATSNGYKSFDIRVRPSIPSHRTHPLTSTCRERTCSPTSSKNSPSPATTAANASSSMRHASQKTLSIASPA